MMSLFSAQGQSQVQIDKTLLNDLVRTAEKLKADNVDLRKIDDNQKIIIESQGIRIVQLEDVNQILKEQIGKVKIAYADIVDTNQKGKFWIWIKGVAVGIVTGALIVLLI